MMHQYICNTSEISCADEIASDYNVGRHICSPVERIALCIYVVNELIDSLSRDVHRSHMVSKYLNVHAMSCRL